MNLKPQSGPTVLVVDDEPSILRSLKSVLSRESYSVVLAASGEEALRYAAEAKPDLVILDLALPGISGLEVCRSLREWFKAPILILSVRDSESDKIVALDLGADDYLTKPFSSGELLARTRALLRRAGNREHKPTTVASGDIVIDLAKSQVTRGGQTVRLTRTEFAILKALAESVDGVVTTRALLTTVWGPDGVDNVQSLRMHMSNLRSKVEEDTSEPRHVITEPGIGYRLVTEP